MQMGERSGASRSTRALRFAAAFVSAAFVMALAPAVVALSLEPAAPQRPFPQHETYANGTIRPSHRTQTQQDADVTKAYAHWKKNYVVKLGGSGVAARYRVAFGPPGSDLYAVTVSEGQGYGMIIVAIMAGHDPDAQAIFDGMARFVKDHPSVIDHRLMGYRVPQGDTPSDSAFDGDADIAYAFLLADAQWGSDGAIDYRASAKRVLAGIYESTIGPQSKLPMLGDWTDPNGPRYNQYTPRSSNFMPHTFRVFWRADGKRWAGVVTATQKAITLLQGSASPKTDLLPDFTEPVSKTDHTPKPARKGFLEGKDDGHYYYNAGRDPWRIGLDALLTGDATSLAQVRKISRWAETAAGGDPEAIKGGYFLDGKPLPEGDYFSTFFAAPFGVAAMTLPNQQQWLNRVYDAVRSTYEGYYEDSVTLLCLLVMTGNYWEPA